MPGKVTTTGGSCGACGSSGCGCFALLVFIACLWGGGQGVYTWITNRQPLVISCQDYLEQRPSAKWLELTDCHVDIENTLRPTNFAGLVPETYVPIRIPGEDAGQRTRILLAFPLDGPVDPEVKPNGLIRFGIDRSNRDIRRIIKTDPSIRENVIILDAGKKPGLALSFLAFGLGLAIVVGVIFLIAMKEPRDETQEAWLKLYYDHKGDKKNADVAHIAIVIRGEAEARLRESKAEMAQGLWAKLHETYGKRRDPEVITALAGSLLDQGRLMQRYGYGRFALEAYDQLIERYGQTHLEQVADMVVAAEWEKKPILQGNTDSNGDPA